MKTRLIAAIALAFAALTATAAKPVVKVTESYGDGIHYWVKYTINGMEFGYGIEAMVRECKVSYYNYPAPKVLLIAPSPTHPDIGKMLFGYVFGPDAYKKSLELGPICKDIAERNGCGFIDCADLDFELNTLDGLHYSKQDHAKLAPVVTAKIKEMIG